MALIKRETLQGFQNLPAFRQIGLMVGLAASIAIGVSIVLWSQTPNYSLLYGNLNGKDASQVLESLQKAHIVYKLDSTSGAIMVQASDVHKARIHLAKEGLPQANGMGLEFLRNEESFRTSKFTQFHRYLHAQEIELARSIATMQSIESARVHLAIPERSAFLGQKDEKPKATVVLKLHSGRMLDYGQVKSIIHLVSSSINQLESSQVTVIDQNGKLLTHGKGGEDGTLTEAQIDYKSRVEHGYTNKIEDLIVPIIGEGRVRAKVDVELDLARTEQTQESYNPDYPAVASEEIREERNSGVSTPTGIPGATTNKPPIGGTTNPQVQDNTQTSSGNSSNKLTRYYKHDKTISHTQKPGGKIRKMSIAVLVDDKRAVNDEGETTRTPLTKGDLEQITELAKGAVGFDAKRGDTIKVTNSTFYTPPVPAPLPPEPLLERAWVANVAKQAAGALVVLIIFFGVLKPIMRSLAERGAGSLAGKLQSPGEQEQLTGPDAKLALPIADRNYDEQINFARNMVGQDPGRVAQVVRSWVTKDG